jgi:hypothetical protein
MSTQLFSPFNIQLIDIDGEFYKIRVNAGDINSFIFNTYQSKFSNNSQKIIPDANDLNDYNAVTTSLTPTYPFPSSIVETFSINENCSIYLSIPKIPAAFSDFYYSSNKKDWWYGTKPEYFINQFRLITSKDEGFEEQYVKDFNYIEKNAETVFTYGNNGSLFLKDSDYPGKIYIKLADITIDQDNKKISVNRFFNSNFISPIRYFRLGALNKRNIEIIYTTLYQQNGEVLLKEYEGPVFSEEDGVLNPDYKYVTKPISKLGVDYSTFKNPFYFNKSLEEIKSNLKNDIQQKINFLNQSYYYQTYERSPLVLWDSWDGNVNSSFSLENFRKGKQFLRKNGLAIFQIIIISRDTLGKKIKVENFYESLGVYNSFKYSINKVNEWIENNPFIYQFDPLPEIKPMTKKDMYQILGLSENIYQNTLGEVYEISTGLDPMIEFVGFA